MSAQPTIAIPAPALIAPDVGAFFTQHGRLPKLVPPPVRPPARPVYRTPSNTDRACSVQKQLRRIEHKLPLQEQWNRAINRWERARKVQDASDAA